MANLSKTELRARKKQGLRKKIYGTNERPRLAVYRSNKHIYAQVIDDDKGATLVSASTLVEGLRDQTEGNKGDAAKRVGKLIAEKCKQANIDKVVFDRGGFIYTGRIAALADAARESGLDF